MATDKPPVGYDSFDSFWDDLGRVLAGQASQEIRDRIGAELNDVKSPMRALLGTLKDIDSELWKDADLTDQ